MARPPLQGFSPKDSEYERPNQRWVCGWAADGHACRIGPDARGHCRATFECLPVQRDGRWRCARPARDGGKCPEGPLPDGTCCRAIPPCQPVRSLRARRGLVTRAAVGFTVGLILVIFGGPRLEGLRRAASSPGPLSMHHASIVACGTCHRSVQGDSALGATVVANAAALGPLSGCLDCHRVPRGATVAAHGLAPAVLARVTDSLRRDSDVVEGMQVTLARLISGQDRTPGTAVPCADCHQEHLGRNVSLMDVASGKCQTCHLRTFTDLRTHPAFVGYPALPPVGFQFRHQKHAAEYFPKDNTTFDCATCHTLDSAGVTMATGSFAAMCAPCHRDQIEQKGMPVFQMPGVDYDLLGKYHVAIGEWPRDANLDLEQDMSPWTRLLLATDPRAAALMRQLDGVDLYYLDQDATEARAAGRLVWTFKALVNDLVREGRRAMLTRLEQAEPGLSARDVAALVDQVPVDSAFGHPGWQRALAAAEHQWFPDLARDVARHGRGLAVPTDPIEDTAEAAADSDSTGWYLTDEYAVAYRATGHADETYRRWLDLTQRPGDTASALTGIYRSLSDPEGPGACMKCHHVRDAGGGKRIAWTSALQRRVPKRGLSDLTPFAHGAHLATPCATCHTYQGDYTFAPIAKRTCMTCHDGRHVSQSCLVCHRYHARSFASRAPIPAPEAPTPDSAAASPTDSAAANSTP